MHVNTQEGGHFPINYSFTVTVLPFYLQCTTIYFAKCSTFDLLADFDADTHYVDYIVVVGVVVAEREPQIVVVVAFDNLYYNAALVYTFVACTDCNVVDSDSVHTHYYYSLAADIALHSDLCTDSYSSYLGKEHLHNHRKLKLFAFIFKLFDWLFVF
jgi:hypothetical protein